MRCLGRVLRRNVVGRIINKEITERYKFCAMVDLNGWFEDGVWEDVKGEFGVAEEKGITFLEESQ